jgi:hypothetical protein
MKCEKGDLAKVLFAIREQNIGKIVVVDQYIGHFKQGEQFTFNEHQFTMPVTDHYWWIAADFGLKSLFGDTPKAYIADSWLEPIRPDKLKASEKELLDLDA